MRISNVNRNEPPRAETVNQLIDAVNALLDMRAGPGIQITHSGGHWAISAAPANPNGTLQTLNCTENTQDTDTYSAAAGKHPVALQVLTEVMYDFDRLRTQRPIPHADLRRARPAYFRIR